VVCYAFLPESNWSILNCDFTERDVPFCGGACLATGDPALKSIPAAVVKSFPNAKNFEAFIVPGAGHGLNLEYSYPLTYSTILSYLSTNGLGA
jgi:hypothetical protein